MLFWNISFLAQVRIAVSKMKLDIWNQWQKLLRIGFFKKVLNTGLG